MKKFVIRIFLANPVYDKLTIARAGNFRKPTTVRKSVRIVVPKEQIIMPPIASLSRNESTTTVCERIVSIERI